MPPAPPSGGGAPILLDEAEGVELTISTIGCAAAPIFRTAALEDCRPGVVFLDTLGEGGGGQTGTHTHTHAHGNGGGKGGGLSPGTVLEIYGASGSGKTEVALNAVCGWVLPRELGGVGGRAIILDMDFRVNVARLRVLLLRRLQKQQVALHPHTDTDTHTHTAEKDDDWITTHLETALKQVVLARCMDELEAFSVLEMLKYDLDKGGASSSSSSSSSGPTLLILDSMGSLLYERKAAEGCRQGQSCFDFMMARCVGRMATAKAVAVLAVKPAVLQCKKTVHTHTCTHTHQQEQQQNGGDGGGGMKTYQYPSLEHREYLPGQWAKLVTHRLTLVKEGGWVGGGAALFSARMMSLGVAQQKQQQQQQQQGGGGAGGGGLVASHWWFTVEEDGLCVVEEGGEGGGA